MVLVILRRLVLGVVRYAILPAADILMSWILLSESRPEAKAGARVIVVDDRLRAAIGLRAARDHPALVGFTCATIATVLPDTISDDVLVCGPVNDKALNGAESNEPFALVRAYSRRRYLERPISNPAYRDEGWSLWSYHVEPVARYAIEMARKVGRDADLLGIAAYLHDIARLDGDDECHHSRGVTRARELLESLGAEQAKIDVVARAIENHRGSVARDASDLDGRILAAADGIATLQFFPLVFYSSFRKHGHGIVQGCLKAEDKLIKAWHKLPKDLADEWRERFEFLLASVRFCHEEPFGYSEGSQARDSF